MFFQKMKIRTKLLLVIGVVLFLLVEVGIFSFLALQQSTQSFQLIQRISFPQIIVSSQLKDKVHTALLSSYDYVATGTSQSKVSYEQLFEEVFQFQIKLYEIAQTDEEFQLSQELNQAVFDVKDKSDRLIDAYESNPENPQITDELAALNAQLLVFVQFLVEDVEAPILASADKASAEIEQRVQTVNRNLILAGILAIITFIGSIIFIRRSITKPINTLLTAAEDFSQGNFYPVELKNQDELGVFANTFTDMGSDIEQATRALEVELDKTRKLDQQKTEFLQVAAHTLRTPVAGIKWLLRMAVEGDIGKLTKEQLYHMQNGLDNADRMVRIVNDLLKTTRVSQPRYAYDYKKAQVVDVVKKVAKQYEQNATAKNITYILDLPKKPLPKAEIDVDKFELAVSNLIDNAIKYSRENTNVWVRLVEIDKTFFQVIVKDEGVGIPKDQQDQIFKKFFRGKNVVQLDTLGSGLGLSMVKDIVDSHEGDIKFESVENKGTTFWVTMPYKQSAPEGEDAPTLKTMAVKLKGEKETNK